MLKKLIKQQVSVILLLYLFFSSIMLYKNIIRTLKYPYRFAQLRSLLPAKFQSATCRFAIITALGKNCFDFAVKIQILDQQYPSLVTHTNLQLFLESGHNYAVVIKAFTRLHEHEPSLSHTSNLQKLVKLGASALDYVSAILVKENLNKTLFITQSDKKNIKSIGGVYTQAAFTHNIFRSISESDLHLEAHTQQWVSKSCQRIRRHSLESSWLVFINEFKNKTEFDLSDRNILKEKCYQTLGCIYAPGSIGEINNLSQLVSAANINSQNNVNRALLQSYMQVLSTTTGLIEQMIPLFPLGSKNSAHDIFLEDLEEILVLPENWGALLQNSASAEMEIVAQELRRALCPSDLFGVNPYPKYRLSINCSDNKEIRFSPEIPHAYISSELLTLQSHIVLEDSDLNFYYQNTDGSYTTRPTSVKNIPGLGTACFFAKFLGDNDPKLGNIAVSVLNPSQRSYIMVALDSDHCFLRKADNPLFANLDEIRCNPFTHETYYHNYFFLRYGGNKASELSNKKILDGGVVLKNMSALPQYQLENFATAFNLAFFPPSAYAMFVEQYMTATNPFVQRLDERIKSHLFLEQNALYKAFTDSDFLMNYSFNSNDIRNNIFYRLDRLCDQVKRFSFDANLKMVDTDLFINNPYLIEDYFFDFCVKKSRVDLSFKNMLQEAFSFYQESDHFNEQESHNYIARLLGLSVPVRPSSTFSQGSSSKTEIISFTPVPFHSDDTEELFATPIILTRQRRLSDIKLPQFYADI